MNLDVERLAQEIQKKWKVLEEARSLGANENVLVAIRKKIYEQQDELIALSSSKHIEYDYEALVPAKKSLSIHTSHEEEALD